MDTNVELNKYSWDKAEDKKETALEEQFKETDKLVVFLVSLLRRIEVLEEKLK